MYQTLIIENSEELEQYYDEQSNTYIFQIDNELVDVEITFSHLNIEANIRARDLRIYQVAEVTVGNIHARDIHAKEITANNIYARNIHVTDIRAMALTACDIYAKDIFIVGNINALDIHAKGIYARNIVAKDINVSCSIIAKDIHATHIEAPESINADDIFAHTIYAGCVKYYSTCTALFKLVCSSIKGKTVNSVHKCLYGKIVLK